MIIKCPQCSTGYSIPEKMVGDKPRKMRCSRCKYVFTITRRKDVAPSGYQEFTGRQHLPDEFAFLKESPKQPPAPLEAPAPQPAPEAPTVDTSPPKEDKRSSSGLYNAVMAANEGEVETVPLEPKLVSSPAEQPVSRQEVPPPTPPAPKEEPAASPEAPPALQEEMRPSAASSVDDIYGGTASAWEMEAPLELGGYALQPETPPKGQAAGKFITAIIILVAGFFVFVAFRNGWSLSVPDLGEQVAFAFSGEAREEIPDEAREIEAEVSGRTLIQGKSGASYLAVAGEVTNDSSTGKSHVILRGRLIDGTGDTRSEVRVPCGKMLEEDVIKATAPGAMQGHYRSGGDLYNCVLSPYGSTIFQVVFDDVPVDYDSSFQVKVTPVAAKTNL